jgi:hypothetical protein
LLASLVSGFHIRHAMLTHNGRIAVPEKDPKTWRSRGCKKRKQPAIASAIVTRRR